MHSTQTDDLEPQRHSRRRPDYLMNASQSRVGGIRSEDSWIDLASQSATNSMHSAAQSDVITSGPHATRNNDRAAIRYGPREISQPTLHPGSVDGSSQDEYEESESESDQVMSSSNEDMTRLVDEEEHDRTTTIGTRSHEARVFTPQPNAFSHPPISNNVQSAPAPNSYFPAYSNTTYSDRLPSNRMITNRTISQRQNSRDHITSSRGQPDHDAALRASLTTLLSCAAAVRPKGRETATTNTLPTQPRTLRLVPESQLPPNQSSPSQPTTKRKSRESSKERQSKKARAHRSPTVGDEPISPTLMTWMISAGVVLVFSAISFSAGYAWGRETAGLDSEIQCVSCGREAVRTVGSGGTLRRLRWSSTAQSIRA